MCDFICGTMSHAKSSMHWSVIHYQVPFEGHPGHGSETSIGRKRINVLYVCFQASDGAI